MFEGVTTTYKRTSNFSKQEYQDEEHTIPATSSTITNNMLRYWVQEDEHNLLTDCITVTSNGINSGYVTYQSKMFAIAQDSYALMLNKKGLGELHYLYLMGVMNKKFSVTYDYQNKAVWSRVKGDYIELPVLTPEDTTPYWGYMAYYIHNIQQQYADQLESKTEYELNLMCQILGVTREEISQRVKFTHPQYTNTFRVGDLFGVKSIKQVPSGFTPNFVDDGIPYLSQKTGGSYGVNGYLNPEEVDGELELITEGMIVTGVDNVANGVMYWWDEPFYANKMVGITHKDLDKWTAQYIITLLLKQYSGYDYNNKISISVIKDTELELPVIAPNSKQIDWGAIRHAAVGGGGQLSGYSYGDMQQRSCDNQEVDSVVLTPPLLKEFKLKDLFEVQNVQQVKLGISSYTKDDDIIHIDGSVPYISATTTNNGIKGYSQLEPNNEEGCITISTTADSSSTIFYQGEPFIGRQQIAGIRFNKGLKIPQRVAMYIMPHIKKYTQGFNYANKLTISKLEELIINLPVTTADDTEPNWVYMEEFIKESEVNYLVKQAIQAQRTIEQIRQII